MAIVCVILFETMIHFFTKVTDFYKITAGFNPRSSRTEDSKIVLDDSWLNTQRHKVRIKCKWNNPRKGVALSPSPWRGSYWKGSLRVGLDNSRLIYSHIYIYIYIYIYIHWPRAECPSMVLETKVQSQVESYQILKKMVLHAALLNTQHYKVRI